MSVGLNETLRSFQLGVASKDENYRVTCRGGTVGIDTNDVGKLKRLFSSPSSKAQIRQNNEVRTMLIQALSNQFNGRQNIPASVLKALNGSSLPGKSDMQLEDNDVVCSGRPLTVRRIRAVLSAVERELSWRPVDQEPGPRDYSHLLIKPEELVQDPPDYSHLLIKPEELVQDSSQDQDVDGNEKNDGTVQQNMPWPVVDEDKLKQLEERKDQMQSQIDNLWTKANDKPVSDPLRMKHAELQRESRPVIRECNELKARRQIGQLAKDVDGGLLMSVANEVLARSLSGGKPQSELWKDVFCRQMLDKEMQMLTSNDKGDCERCLRNAGASENEIPVLKEALNLLKKGYATNKHLIDRVRTELDNVFNGRSDGDVSLVNFAQKQLLKELRDIAEARKEAGGCVELQAPHLLNVNGEHRPMGLKSSNVLAGGTVFMQTQGGNLCPILSTMNAMMLSNKDMADRLRNAMVLRDAEDGKGSYFEFPYKLAQSKENLRIYLNDLGTKDMEGEDPIRFGALSQFEQAAYMAMKKAELLELNQNGNPVHIGDFFEVGGAFQLFGFDEPKQIGVPNSQSGVPGGELCLVGKQVADELRDGKVCVFRKPGHFMALRSVTFDKEGLPSFKVFDSSFGGEMVYSPKNLIGEGYEIYCAG